MKLTIYMDYHATTPVDPRVLEAMLPYFNEKFGNAASTHGYGNDARAAVEKARAQVAALLNASTDEIAFTSGGTEGDNLAIKGAAAERRERGDHIISCVTGHKAVLDSYRSLEGAGYRITYLPVDQHGRLRPEDVKAAIEPKTILVSLMAANNEIGTIHPVAEIGRICRERDILFHSDATQAIARIPFDVRAMQVDLAAFTAHKFYGPKGAGALYVRRGVKIRSEMDGGGHEGGLRSGTLNVPGIVGLGLACELARLELQEEAQRIGALRDRLQQAVVSKLDNVTVNGDPDARLPGNLNLSFKGLPGGTLALALDDIACSAGSACNSQARSFSHVLKALGLDEDRAESTVRFGLGRFTTEVEVDHVAARVVEAVTQLRALTV